MNIYKVSFSLFHKDNGSHFSNCIATIEGETFDDAVENLKEDKLKQGWIVGFLARGEHMFKLVLK